MQSKFTIRTMDGGETLANLEFTQWSKNLARPIAVKWAFGILLAGVLSLAIPIIHFVSFPASLITAPIAYILILNLFSSGLSVTGNVVCPGCRNSVDCRQSASRFPIQFQCEACRCSCEMDLILNG